MHTVLKNNKPIKKSELKIGDLVSVISFFGMVTLTVDSIKDDNATLYNKKGTWIKLGDDGYYEVTAAFDPRAICRIKLI